MVRTLPDTSLEPEIPCGARLSLSLKRKPCHGDLICYEPLSGMPVFRRYTEKKDGKILLQAVNDRYSSFVSNRAEMKKRGRIYVITSFSKSFYPDDEDQISEVSSSEYLTFDETLSYLKIGRTNLYTLLQTGKLAASKAGKLWRIPRSAADAYLKEK